MVNTEIMLKNGILKLDETLERISPSYNPDGTMRPRKKKISQKFKGSYWRSPDWNLGHPILNPEVSPLPNTASLQRREKGPICKRS